MEGEADGPTAAGVCGRTEASVWYYVRRRKRGEGPGAMPYHST